KEVFTAFNYTKPRRMQMTPAMKAGEEMVTTFEDKAKLFRKTLFPPLPEHTAPPPERNDRQPPKLWQPVSPEEVRWAIFTSSPTKAPDSKTPEAEKTTTPQEISFLKYLGNRSTETFHTCTIRTAALDLPRGHRIGTYNHFLRLHFC